MDQQILSGEALPAQKPIVDFVAVGKRFIEIHGIDKACEITGKSKALVAQWPSGAKNPTVEDLQALLTYDPDPLHAVMRLYEPMAAEGNRLAIVMVTNRQPHPATMESVLKLFDSTKMRFIRKTSNFLIRGRNQAAWAFLQSGCEWALWVDDDMVLPCGDAEWFRKATGSPKFPEAYAGLNTIGRLIYHKKTLVGGCYFNRVEGGKAQFNEAALSAEIDASVKHRGPSTEVCPTKWVATGCMLVHRSVYVDIVKKFPQIQISPEQERYLGYRYGFFDPIEPGMGEDVSFCRRADEAGHTPHVDFAVMPAHIGWHAYNYFNT